MKVITLAEHKILPDKFVRFGIRQLLRQRLREENAENSELQSLRYRQLLHDLRSSPVAIQTDAANEQHYEVPTEFFQYVLGKHLKYSGSFWDERVENLDQAEAHMLDLYLQRAQLGNHQQILELGCGWGSLTLLMAKRYPQSQITAVSNSQSQREYIEQQAIERDISNITVITCDVNNLELNKQFHRIVSIEMFEHMRNYEKLLAKVANWLKPQGKVFIHIFCHRFLAYPFETKGDDNWMGRYFFTGGLMPARDTLLHFQKHLNLQCQWDISGSHYQKTAEAWLDNMDANQAAIRELFIDTYGKKHAGLWFQRWRIFFMACAELFGYKNGNEWMVSHYLFSKN